MKRLSPVSCVGPVAGRPGGRATESLDPTPGEVAIRRSSFKRRSPPIKTLLYVYDSLEVWEWKKIHHRAGPMEDLMGKEHCRLEFFIIYIPICFNRENIPARIAIVEARFNFHISTRPTGRGVYKDCLWGERRFANEY